jgi:hypothetical protein
MTRCPRVVLTGGAVWGQPFAPARRRRQLVGPSGHLSPTSSRGGRRGVIDRLKLPLKVIHIAQVLNGLAQ